SRHQPRQRARAAAHLRGPANERSPIRGQGEAAARAHRTVPTDRSRLCDPNRGHPPAHASPAGGAPHAMTAFVRAHAVRLPDEDYYDFMFASLETARRRVWVSQFICDIRPPRDVAGRVLDLVTALVVRRAIGVDVRVLLSGAAATPDIDVANLATGMFLENHQVPHRRLL